MVLIVLTTTLQAQTYLPGSFIDNSYRGALANNIHFNDSSSQKKWFLTRYTGISASYSFYKGGQASVISAPLAVQLNRRLNDNLYAFAGVTLVPSYINFRQSFVTADFNKGNLNNSFSKSGSLGVYSSASLGLMYVNDEKTFSVSGSISVERSNYPMLPYYPVNQLRSTPANPALR